MAIFTRLGAEVEIIGHNHNTGDIEVRYLSSGDIENFAIYELKADGGVHEIDEACKMDDFPDREYQIGMAHACGYPD